MRAPLCREGPIQIGVGQRQVAGVRPGRRPQVTPCGLVAARHAVHGDHKPRAAQRVVLGGEHIQLQPRTLWQRIPAFGPVCSSVGFRSVGAGFVVGEDAVAEVFIKGECCDPPLRGGIAEGSSNRIVGLTWAYHRLILFVTEYGSSCPSSSG